MAMWALLHESEVFLLFVIVLTGLVLGRVRIKGFSLGVSAVLFSGLLLGALRDPEAGPLQVSHSLRDFGLVIFVYAIGLTSGPGFFDALRRRGIGLNAAVLISLSVGVVIVLSLGRAWSLPAGMLAGVYCGSLTNTPALAAVVDLARGSGGSAEPTLGYSVTYPFGILGGLLALRITTRLRAKAFAAERSAVSGATRRELATANFRVTNPEIFGKAIGALRVRDATGLRVSRLKHGDETIVPNKYALLREGDVLAAVGTAEELERAEGFFGQRAPEHLEARREDVDMRRILVSRKEVAGKTLEDLAVDLSRFHAQITRLRRTDLEIVPTENTRIELGDRLRVVAPTSKMRELGAFFGDSERAASEVDFVGVAVGIVLGLLVGSIPIPTPGGDLRLGIAGGPLVVALVLGRVGRTGALVWILPYDASRLLRELGLLLFLAAVGTTAGGQLAMAAGPLGLTALGVGAAVTAVTNGVLVGLLTLWQRSSVISTLGVASGLQTQPATLASAYELSDESDEVYVSYAVVYPVAMVGKILLAQVVYILGSS